MGGLSRIFWMRCVFSSQLISEFIKVLLFKWGEELNARDVDLKMSVKGKIEAGTYAQTR